MSHRVRIGNQGGDLFAGEAGLAFDGSRRVGLWPGRGAMTGALNTVVKDSRQGDRKVHKLRDEGHQGKCTRTARRQPVHSPDICKG